MSRITHPPKQNTLENCILDLRAIHGEALTLEDFVDCSVCERDNEQVAIRTGFDIRGDAEIPTDQWKRKPPTIGVACT